MKKFILSAFALCLVSFSFANSENLKPITENLINVPIECSTENKVETSIDDIWFCRKTSTSMKFNDFSGEITITTTYICTWYDF